MRTRCRAERHSVARAEARLPALYLTDGRVAQALVAAAVAISGVAVIVTARDVALAIAALFALLVPGIALAWTVLPHAVARPTQLMPTLAISVATIALGGLVLNLTPLGLSSWSWFALGLALLGLAWALPGGRSTSLPERPRTTTLPLGHAAMSWAAAVLVVVALVTAGARAPAAAERFSQLWLVPATSPASPETGEGANEAAPTEAAQPAAEVGVRNVEGQTMTYRVELWLDEALVSTWPDVTLANGGTWTAPVDVAVPADVRLEARLFTAATPAERYRTATLWGPIARASATGSQS